MLLLIFALCSAPGRVVVGVKELHASVLRNEGKDFKSGLRGKIMKCENEVDDKIVARIRKN